ncbi:NHL repeat-containing protein [Gilvimarinus agarilyticus]|uniref:hypothetical protein n=1 Tax=Gilvimarinus agarilyticus TaxID=679259 RepID=UPI0005A0A03D|nr:hypothetical protein [Gilvimarinus agarilyticus]
MKGKSLCAAIIIVALSSLAMMLYLWAGAKRAEPPSYGFMHPDGQQLAVNFGSHLVWLDDAGRERAALDIADLGLRPVGDFGFFSDGDLLLYHRSEPYSVLDNLAAFFRLRASREVAASSDEGFYRCDLELERCRRLADSEQHPARSFRLLILPDTDTILLADTADHALYKLTPEGRQLASNQRDCKFPNQLLWHEGDVWLADNNHHRVVSVSSATDNFGRKRQTITTELGGEHRWPHQLAASDEGIWVLVGNNAMANGRLQFYRWSGAAERRLPLAGVDDPLAISFWRDHLWVSDFAEPKLLKIDPQSGMAEQADSATLARLYQQTESGERYYRRLEWLAMGLFGLVLLGGFAAAWKLEKQQTLERFNKLSKPAGSIVVDGEVEPTGQSDILWIPSAIKPYHWWLANACWVMAALMLLMVVLTYQSLADTPAILWMGVGTAGFMALAGYMTRALLASVAHAKLGVIGESLVLVSARGERTVARARELAYSPQFIFADDVAIALGNTNLRFYDEQALKRWVYPRLKSAQKINAYQQVARLWHLRHPQVIWPTVLLAVLSVAVLALKLWG